MNRLVDIRIQDAVENITRINGVLTKAVTRKSSIGGPQKNLRPEGGWEESVKKIKDSVKKINDLILECQSYTEGTAQIRDETVDVALKAMVDLRASLNKMSRGLLQPENESTEAGRYDAHKSNTEDWLKAKKQYFEFTLPSWSEKPSGELLQEIDDNKPYWAEHIETAAGIVLRDEEFDTGLAVFADEIVRLCRSACPLISITVTPNILAGEKTELRDLRRHAVYFRFPTWSIWGLSLAAHDAWHASDKGAKLFLEKLGMIFPGEKEKDTWIEPFMKDIWEKTFIQNCLADAYATYIIGPAYAFSSILLSLDVHSDQDQARAESIFATLEYLASLDGDKPVVADLLRDLWKTAGGAAHQDHRQNRPCLLKQECGVGGGLWQAYWASLSQAESSAAPADPSLSSLPCSFAHGRDGCPLKDGSSIAKMRDTLLKFLPPTMRYPEDEWLCAGPSLLKYFHEGERELLGETTDIRHILRAAWLVRVEKDRMTLDGIAGLAGQALELCKETLEGRPKKILFRDTNGSNASLRQER